MDPDCNVGMVQTTLPPVGALHVPEPAVALLKVAPEVTLPLTVMLVARSGPSFVMV